MLKHKAPIYFYIPQKDWPQQIPEDPDIYWQGFSWGIFAWTLQTYLHLKADHFSCELVGTIPKEGIVLAHRDSLPFDLKPQPKLLIVCLKADRGLHPYAQLHVVQHPLEHHQIPQKLGSRYYLPHWIQPGLIPRDPQRGDRFENIAYLGTPNNLTPELQDPAWSEQLQRLGLTWQMVSRNAWHDYSQIDAVVAVRRFDAVGDPNNFKPATKLYNAWNAGVPAILGCETAFQAERRSELDYIEVSSIVEVKAALQRLQDNPELRQKIVENGRMRSQQTQPSQVSKRWQNFILEMAIPTYQQWCALPRLSQQFYIFKRYAQLKQANLKRRFKRGSHQFS